MTCPMLAAITNNLHLQHVWMKECVESGASLVANGLQVKTSDRT
jgi:hypothetical protein